MLSQLVILAAEKQPKRSERPYISISQLYPCPYRIWLLKEGKMGGKEPTGQNILNMENGATQEEESIQKLLRAGIKIEDRQCTVTVGNSKVPGHIDGTYTASSVKRLWEHKAMNTDNYNLFREEGLEAFPGYMVQFHLYLNGMGLKQGVFYVKHKDSNTPYDVLLDYKEGFALEIIDWLDKIIIDKWKPEPKETKWCKKCGVDCFGPIMDFSKIATLSDKETVDKWKQGKKLKTVGESLIEEARVRFKTLIGDRKILMVEDLKISNIISHGWTIDQSLLLARIGADVLMEISKEKITKSMRVDPTIKEDFNELEDA